MAYWFMADDKPDATNQVQFYMDNDSDTSSLPTSSSLGVKQGTNDVSCLPCGKGSLAYSINTGSLFILNSNDEWIKQGG